MNSPLLCGFCYDREQGTHGEIKREWSDEWMMYIPVCRKHALADGMIDGQPQDTNKTKPNGTTPRN